MTAIRSRAKAAGPAYWLLALLVLAGLALRIVAAASWWPAGTTLSDAVPYAAYAETDPLGDPQHPAGYPLLLALIGFVTREVAVVILLQYLTGIGSALLLFVAVRRATGSPWPGLAPAAVVLLNADQIFLEHTIMSEGVFLLVIAAALYAGVRAVEEPEPWWRWPTAAVSLVVMAATFRSAAVFLLPVLVLAIFFARPGPWRARWRAPAAAAAVGAALLLAYATTNLVANDRVEIGPTQGWHLYGRVAPFADCGQITPPDGTDVLCETSDPNTRPGGDFYLYLPDSPAKRAYGPEPWREYDDEMGAWAREVILHMPKTYARAVWRDLRTYFVPGSRPPTPWAGGELDPELDWTAGGTGHTGHPRGVERGLEQAFFDPFEVSKSASGVEFLHDYQRVLRFGATLLVITSLLVLAGLLVGPRRSRIAVLLFGVGALAMLAGPTLSVWPTGRYTVPLAPLVTAGAAIAVLSLTRVVSERRRRVPSPRRLSASS